MTEFTDSITRPDESLAIVNDYARKPNENWFFSVSAKAVQFLLEENRYLSSSGCEGLWREETKFEELVTIIRFKTVLYLLIRHGIE